jgi:hypothetical protein
MPNEEGIRSGHPIPACSLTDDIPGQPPAAHIQLDHIARALCLALTLMTPKTLRQPF